MAGLTVSSCIAEFVGTFLLVFTVGCNVLGSNATWGAVSIACVLMVSTYALGAVSGANFNPAVTLSLQLAKKLEDGWVQLGAYMAVQCIGGLAATGAFVLLFGGGFALAPKPGFTVGAILCEVIYTFMLCFVVLNVAASKKCKDNQYFGLAIGWVIIAGGYGAGALGAGCFNPAVALGICSSSFFAGALWLLAYVFAEFCGAALATGCFLFLREEEQEPSAVAPKDYGLKSKLVGEAIGTFMLVFTVGLNVLGESPAAAFSIAASFMCMIFAIGDISGGHFNPAVTLALVCSGKSPMADAKEAGFYVLAQLGGSLLAALAYTGAHNGATFPLGPGASHGWAGVGFVETVFTFVLTFTVLSVALQEVRQPSQFVALIIGSCVIVGGFAAGPISGGSLNPAVSCGISAAHIIGGGFFYKSLIYSVFELLGGAMAGAVYQVLFGEAFGQKALFSKALVAKAPEKKDEV